MSDTSIATADARPRPAPPPAEFVGKARAFRARIQAADRIVHRDLDRILWTTRTTLKGRTQKGKAALRPDTLVDLSRRWKALDGLGRLQFQSVLLSTGLRVEEIRLRISVSADLEWRGATEPSVAIVRQVFIIDGARMRLDPEITAAISLHALARRFQRGLDDTDVALLADLTTLAVAAPGLIRRSGSTFTVPVAGGAAWFGEMIRRPSSGQRLASVRTFL